MFEERTWKTLKDWLLVHALITMAHDLGYRVMAEGIEMQDAFDMLRSWGCDEGQDYLLSRPVAPSVTGAWRGRYVAA